MSSHHHHHRHTQYKGRPGSDEAKENESLSSTILNYYHKYGQNRDIEKYFHIRRGLTPDRSADVSPETCTSRLGKSLENLSILNAIADEQHIHKSHSNDSLDKKSGGSQEKPKKSHSKENIQVPPPKTEDDNRILIKHEQKAKKKKAYQMNMESNIEISFPATITQPEYYAIAQPLPQILPTAPEKTSESIETQTDKIEYPKTPLKPLLKQTNFDLNTGDMPRPISAASSVMSTSNKQRLEWDSLADVGYDKSMERSQSFESSLTTFERSALRKFFAERGMNFDDNIIVFGSKNPASSKSSIPNKSNRSVSVDSILHRTPSHNRSTKAKWELAFRKILDEKLSASGKLDSAQSGKDLWKSALKKFREKYGHQINVSNDLCITHPEVHSTPLPSPKGGKSTGAIPKRPLSRKDSSHSDEKPKIIPIKEMKEASTSVDNIGDIMETIQKPSTKMHNIATQFDKINLMERSCQTSLISVASKECQADPDLSACKLTIMTLSNNYLLLK